jgi:hypothetical protein
MALMYNRSQKNSSQKGNFQKLFLKNNMKPSKEGSLLKSNGGFENNHPKSFTNEVLEEKSRNLSKNEFQMFKLEEKKPKSIKKICNNNVSSNQHSPKWIRNKRCKRGTKYRVKKLFFFSNF